MTSSNPEAELTSPEAQVWDSNIYDSADQVGRFRELVSSSLLPMRVECDPKLEFKARFESIKLGMTGIVRSRHSPMSLYRTKGHIDNSPVECLYASLIISGSVATDLGSINWIANQTELVMGGSRIPGITNSLSSSVDSLTLVIPKIILPQYIANVDNFYASLPWRGTPTGPLVACLTYIVNNMFGKSAAELQALVDSAICLFPVATGSLSRTPTDEFEITNPALRKIIRFINSNLQNPNLSAREAGEEVGISERYVQKLFAAHGKTFNTYVTAKRLDCVCVDLSSNPKKPIASIAYGWGFNDLSSFNKSFKERFGWTPSRYRRQVD